MKLKLSTNHKEQVSPVFLAIAVISIASMLIANILANRMLQVGPWAMDAGILVFPITYMISDIVSEVYGYKWSRRISWLSAVVNLSGALLIMLAMVLPYPEWFDASHFSLALNSSLRIVVASLFSYVIGDWIDDIIFEKMRVKAKGAGSFKTRAIISSIGGATVDTTIFILIAFLFTIPSYEIIPMIALGVFGKIVYEITILPVTSLFLKKVQAYELSHQQREVI